MIVGISGLANSGKDSTGDLLVKHFGFAKVAFADPIKRAAMDWWEFTEHQLWGPSEMRNQPDKRYRVSREDVLFARRSKAALEGGGIVCPQLIADCAAEQDWEYLTPRSALQKIGTEGARAAETEVWVRYGLRVAKQLQGPNKAYYRTKGIYTDDTINYSGVVITDMRFENEVDAVLGAGGIVIRIKRPDAGLSGEAGKHASEEEQASIPDSKFNYILNNDSSLDALEKKVFKMSERLKISSIIESSIQI